ncbi:DUF4172 domain-containing protein [Aeromonas caviae]|uniref:DUF4172 domain-containing protein n=1 Tax=Aeromonas caviae TaxID=648 RepID=UPI0038CFA594
MEPLWIWQQADWPHFRWQDSEILPRLRHVQRRQGILIGRHSRLGNQGEIVNILLKIKNSFLPTKQILIGL